MLRVTDEPRGPVRLWHHVRGQVGEHAASLGSSARQPLSGCGLIHFLRLPAQCWRPNLVDRLLHYDRIRKSSDAVEDVITPGRELIVERVSVQPQSPLSLCLIRESCKKLSERAELDLAMLCDDAQGLVHG